MPYVIATKNECGLHSAFAALVTSSCCAAGRGVTRRGRPCDRPTCHDAPPCDGSAHSVLRGDRRLLLRVFAPRFATATNAENLMSGFSFAAILAMGQAFPILVRGIDLSIGAIVGVVGMVVFDMAQILHAPGYVILPAAIVVGTLAGVLNGVLIVFLEASAVHRDARDARRLPRLHLRDLRPPTRARAHHYADHRPVDRRHRELFRRRRPAWALPALSPSPWFPLSFFIMLAMLALFQTVLLKTRFGRDLYAVGGNIEAARLAGINTGRTIVAAYAIAGFCAAVTALIMVARFTTSTEALGTGMELTAIAAAVIGGVSLTGGVGSMFGPALGAFLLGAVLLGLTLMGVPQFVQQVLTGVILLAAVGYDRLLSRETAAPPDRQSRRGRLTWPETPAHPRDRPHQGLRPSRRAERSGLDGHAGRGARADRLQRRGQVDAGQDSHRRGRADARALSKSRAKPRRSAIPRK